MTRLQLWAALGRAVWRVTALVVLYVLAWHLMSPTWHDRTERYAVAASVLLLAAVGIGLVVAFVDAEWTRLNWAFMALFLMIGIFAVVLGAPATLGVIVNDAPLELNRVRNPYELWHVSAELRTAIWIGLALSAAGVGREFLAANYVRDGWRIHRRYRPA